MNARTNQNTNQNESRHTLVPLDDNALMLAVATGDQQAGRVFIARHLPYVLKICRAKLRHEAEAEEAAQDVFASVWKNASHWEAGHGDLGMTTSQDVVLAHNGILAKDDNDALVSGTEHVAARIAGAAVLMRYKFLTLPDKQLKEILLKTATDMTPPMWSLAPASST